MYAKEPIEMFYDLASFIEEESDMYIKEKLKKTVYGLRNQKMILTLLLLMYKLNLFEAQYMQLYMQLLKEITWTDYTLYNLVIDTTLMVFIHPELLYANFFGDRIELQKKICEDFRLYDVVNISESKKSNKRIAIVTERFAPNDIVDAPSIIIP